ncbi:hypothetical protein D0469_04220 [Peribacillus saganii]|uniref:Uncharacterized protein n=1 Tax=Peribacillus saganii TaxID=2303992 RepID=A0A372LTM6_9BACI|nr:hypothetical protein [Peribacillus saganii]RFU71150.1 hypothetical protein D0469_04220 [Peribacillus saganii]
MKKFLIFYILLLSCAGCGRQIPEPENLIENLAKVPSAPNAEASQLGDAEKFIVRHFVRGNDVFVECIIKDFSFTRQDEQQSGKLIVSVDGKRKEEIQTAAFIIKGVDKGPHTIKLELVDEKNRPYSIEKEFKIHI